MDDMQHIQDTEETLFSTQKSAHSNFDSATMAEDQKGREGYAGVTSRQTKQREILLIPQPSSDPREPLVCLSFSLLNAFTSQRLL